MEKMSTEFCWRNFFFYYKTDEAAALFNRKIITISSGTCSGFSFEKIMKPCFVILLSLLIPSVAVGNGLTIPSDSIALADTSDVVAEIAVDAVTAVTDTLATDSMLLANELSSAEIALGCQEVGEKLTLYDYPYSQTRSMPDWRRLWLNTGILMGAGVSTMLILEALPSDATAWNKTENGKVGMFERWWRNVHLGPVWDKDSRYSIMFSIPMPERPIIWVRAPTDSICGDRFSTLSASRHFSGNMASRRSTRSLRSRI